MKVPSLKILGGGGWKMEVEFGRARDKNLNKFYKHVFEIRCTLRHVLPHHPTSILLEDSPELAQPTSHVGWCFVSMVTAIPSAVYDLVSFATNVSSTEGGMRAPRFLSQCQADGGSWMHLLYIIGVIPLNLYFSLISRQFTA